MHIAKNLRQHDCFKNIEAINLHPISVLLIYNNLQIKNHNLVCLAQAFLTAYLVVLIIIEEKKHYHYYTFF